MFHVIVAESGRIRFRKTNEDDLVFVQQAEQHPENRPYVITWPREKHLEAINSEDHLHMVITDPEGRAVGYIIAAGITNPNNCVELTRIAITEKGNGYGKEAIRLFQTYVFETLRVHRLWLDVKAHNRIARLLYEKTGFVVEGVLRDCIQVQGTYESLVIMGILENEYISRT
ncbi:GNAT family N-acetyltransferase [Paenibacillus sp. GCM10012303]|uniref:GNAT family N-acetyltransferase n=1 Tax=Paenibacillus sp. GCM10012303 TaxID=3317340 RepID=UPI00361E9401